MIDATLLLDAAYANNNNMFNTKLMTIACYIDGSTTNSDELLLLTGKLHCNHRSYEFVFLSQFKKI